MKNVVKLLALSTLFFPLRSFAVTMNASTPVDPLTLSESDLSNLSIEELSSIFSTLTTVDKQEANLYPQLQSFNKEMCKQLTILNAKCLTQAYLYTPQVDHLGCQLSSSPPVIKVIANNLKGYTFRIFANQYYVSNEFGEGGGILTFQRNDGQPVTPPRFRQITGMMLVSVSPGSSLNKSGYLVGRKAISSADQAALISSMQFMITVNGTPLIPESQKKWLPLLAPIDPNTTTELRVDSQTILSMGKSPECVMSADDLNKIRQAAGVSQ